LTNQTQLEKQELTEKHMSEKEALEKENQRITLELEKNKTA